MMTSYPIKKALNGVEVRGEVILGLKQALEKLLKKNKEKILTPILLTGKPMKINIIVAYLTCIMLVISCGESAKKEKKVLDSTIKVKEKPVTKIEKKDSTPPKDTITIATDSPFKNVEQKLIGKHVFGVQFIWNKYGTATIGKESGELKISGEQYSKDKTEYAKIKGTITIISQNKFRFKGTIQIFTTDCCGKIDKTGDFTFAKTGTRNYWRLQELSKLCSPNTCAYYLDIFE
jgi:hypothetical protein